MVMLDTPEHASMDSGRGCCCGLPQLHARTVQHQLALTLAATGTAAATIVVVIARMHVTCLQLLEALSLIEGGSQLRTLLEWLFGHLGICGVSSLRRAHHNIRLVIASHMLLIYVDAP